jgi:hypothetical protein
MKIIRGDTKRYKFQRVDADGNVITERPAGLFFTVKESWGTQEPTFQKTIDDMEFDDDPESDTYGYWCFTIRPEDTNDLPYETYVCDIEVVRDFDKLEKTTIMKDQFKILGESTWATNEQMGEES